MKNQLTLLLLAFLMTSCASEGKQTTAESTNRTPGIATSVETHSHTPMSIRTDMTATPLPTQLVGILEHWRGYEIALAQSMIPSSPTDEVICEWEVLGESANELYVWAVCTATVPVPQTEDRYTSINTVAVIHLGEDGEARYVKRPSGGTHFASDIREMFPEDAQDKFFSNSIDYKRLKDHLVFRRDNSFEPPLVVLDATKMP